MTNSCGRRALSAVHQEVADRLTDGVPGDVHRGERRMAELRQGDVVEPRHRHVLGNAAARDPELPQAPTAIKSLTQTMAVTRGLASSSARAARRPPSSVSASAAVAT